MILLCMLFNSAWLWLRAFNDLLLITPLSTVDTPQSVPLSGANSLIQPLDCCREMESLWALEKNRKTWVDGNEGRQRDKIYVCTQVCLCVCMS